MNLFCLASFSDRLALLLPRSLTGRVLGEFLVISSAVLLVTGTVVACVLFFRRSPTRTRIYKRPHRPAAEAAPAAVPEAPRRNRRRRRKRGEPPRNPTLAETGGLPPVRRPETPPPDFPY